MSRCSLVTLILACALNTAGAIKVRANETNFPYEQVSPVPVGYDAGLHTDFSAPGGIPRQTTAQSAAGKCGFGLAENPRVPDRFLAACDNEPLPLGITDMRGMWDGQKLFFGVPASRAAVRIEQCKDRLMIVTGGYVHDYVHGDGSETYGLIDYDPKFLPQCMPLTRVGVWDAAGCFVMIKAAGDTPMEKLCLDNKGQLNWKFLLGPDRVMKRVQNGAFEQQEETIAIARGGAETRVLKDTSSYAWPKHVASKVISSFPSMPTHPLIGMVKKVLPGRM